MTMTERTIEQVAAEYQAACERWQQSCHAWQQEIRATGQLNGPAYRAMQEARRVSDQAFDALRHDPRALHPDILANG